MEQIITLQPINLDSVSYDSNKILQKSGIIKNYHSCLRPGHKTNHPVIKTESLNDKLIFHNYGHSGVGYTILFGSVNKSIKDFLNLNHNKDELITIVGNGIIGLTTALSLYYKGYTNIKIYGQESEGIPSYHAGGLLDIVFIPDEDSNKTQILCDYLEETFLTYKAIEDENHPFLKSNNLVRMIDYFYDFKSPGLIYLAQMGHIPEIKTIKTKFGDKGITLDLHYTKTYFINTPNMMKECLRILKEKGINIIYQNIKNFEEISSRIIFNCTGNGSKELAKDDKCIPVCGHILELNDEKYSNYDYIVCLDGDHGFNSKYGRDLLFYFMPKGHGFIGGSYMKGYDGKDDKINKEMFSLLVDYTNYLYGNKMNPKF